MRTRLKVFCSIAVAMVLAMVAVHFGSRRVLMDHFVGQEATEVRRGVERVVKQIGAWSEQLSARQIDRTAWDNAHAFGAGGRTDFAIANPQDQTPADMQLSAIVFLDENGNVLFAKGATPDHTAPSPVDPELISRLLSGPELTRFASLRDTRAGVLLLQDGPVLFAARPVTTTDSRAAPAGICVMTRRLDNTAAAQLSRLTGQDVSWQRIDGSRADLDAVAALLSIDPTPRVEPIDDTHINGVGLVRDVAGRPALLVKTSGGRPIYAEGLSILRGLAAKLAIGMAVLGGVTFWLFEAFVMSRVTRLSRQLRRITATRDLSNRIKSDGVDEVAQLALPINQMLDTLADADAQRRAQADLLRRFVEQSPAAVAMFDSAGRLMMASGRWREELGLTQAAQGTAASELLASWRDVWAVPFAQCVNAAKASIGENTLTLPGGRIETLRWGLRPWSTEAGAAGGAMLFLECVTERRRAEAAVRESEIRFRTLADSLPVFVWVSDAQGKVQWRNRLWFELVGAPIDASAFDWSETIHPDDTKKSFATYTAAHAERRAFEVTMRVRRYDGEYRVLKVFGVPRVVDGEFAGLVGAGMDVTEQQQAQQELLESRELFRNAFHESGTGIGIADADGRITKVNAKFAEITGYSADELRRMTFQEITHPDDIAGDVALAESVIAGTRRNYSLEKRYIHRAGHEVWVSLNVGVVRTSHNHPAYLIAHVQDISSRKRDEAELRTYTENLILTKDALEQSSLALAHQAQQLETAKAAAESASRTKGTFLANMSHEIRTPMTSILGYADVLLDPELDDADRRHCVGTIRSNGEHLMSLLNDVLDISKIEAGAVRVESLACDPRGLVNDVIGLMRLRAAEKNLTLVLEPIDSDTPTLIRTDPTRLRQILLNLLSNAVKFARDGAVKLRLARVCRTGGSDALRITVTDNGIGMSDETTASLFQPFKQADASTTRHFGGTGLGLTISKRLAEMLGGNLIVSSQVGVGSVFALTIDCGEKAAPHAATTGVRPANPAGYHLAGARLLLAEDGPDNQQLVAFYMKRAGATLEIVENGAAAIAAVEEAQRQGRSYDAVLMDMQMPVMDGYDATRALRAAGVEIPVIALTAHAMGGDRELCLAAGCSDYLSKPVDRQLLLSTLDRWLVPHASATQTITTPTLAA